MRRPWTIAAVALLAFCEAPAGADIAHANRTAPPPHETVGPLSRHRLPGGDELIAVEVRFPPGVAAAAHRHPAFVYAYVVSGTIVSALDGEKPVTFRAGQSWSEPPGALHRVTRNASATRSATLLAIFIAAPGTSDLVQPDGGRQ